MVTLLVVHVVVFMMPLHWGLQLLLVHVVTSHQELPLCDLSNVVAFGYNDVLLKGWWLNNTCVSVSSRCRLMKRP